MLRFILVPLLLAGCAALISCTPATDNKDAADQQVGSANTETEKPRHEQLVEKLRTHKGVEGDLVTDMHPVHSVFNREAPVPPQCYTRIEGKHNPCYVCHQNEVPGRENTLNDGEQQLAYNFSDVGLTNHWKNLFEDRSAEVAKISDDEILDWIDDDNYSNLAPRLKEAKFEGWIPDLKNLHLGPDAFDEFGFAKDGSDWVAFNYKPLPSTFWPTNGSTDDVMIRLPERFRSDADEQVSSVGDGGVREHPLHARLNDRDHVPDEH